MAITRPVTQTVISTTGWGIPVTDRINDLDVRVPNVESEVNFLQTFNPGIRFSGSTVAPKDWAVAPYQSNFYMSTSMTIVAQIAPDTYTGTYQTIAARWPAVPNNAFMLRIDTDGRFSCYVSANGTSSSVSTVTLPHPADGQWFWFAVIINFSDTGYCRARWYTSADGVTWAFIINTDLAVAMTPGVTTGDLVVGLQNPNAANPFKGRIGYVSLRANAGNTQVVGGIEVARFDATLNWQNGKAVDPVGNTWDAGFLRRVNQAATYSALPAFALAYGEYWAVQDTGSHYYSDGTRWRTIATGDEYIGMVFKGPGSTDQARAPLNPAVPVVTGDMSVVFHIKAPATAWPTSTWIGLGGHYISGSMSWWLGIYNDRLYFNWSKDGTVMESTATRYSLPLALTLNQWYYIGVTHDVDDGAGGNVLKYWKSTDGINWTDISVATIVAAGTGVRYSTTSPLFVGSLGPSGLYPYLGEIRLMSVSSGIAAGGQPAGIEKVVFRADEPWYGGTYLDPYGTEWTASNAGLPMGALVSDVPSVASLYKSHLWAVDATKTIHYSDGTQWRVAYGDTGWRDITAWDAAGVVTGVPLPAGWKPRPTSIGWLRLRRVGNTVYTMIHAVSCAVANNNDPLITLPVGFQCYPNGMQFPVMKFNSAVSTGTLFPLRVGLTIARGSGGAIAVDDCLWELGMQWSVQDSWPTTLPGTAVGVIP